MRMVIDIISLRWNGSVEMQQGLPSYEALYMSMISQHSYIGVYQPKTQA